MYKHYITYADLEVSVEKGLEVESSVAIVGNNNSSVKTFRIKRDTVDESKLVGPKSLEVVADALGGKTKVELHAGARALAGRLSKELPSRVTSKTVLGKLGYGFVVGGSTEDL
jgi:hypothetical protein